MGFNIFNIKEDSKNPSPPQIYNWRLYFCALAASMGSAMFGYDSAFIGGTLSLPSFQRDFGLTSQSAEVRAALSAHIVSTFQGGCFFGAILIYWLNERFGRRKSLITAGTVFCIGVIMQLCSVGRIGLMYAGRAFTGLGVGSSSLVIPQYIAECAPPAVRGGLVGLFEICLQLGTVVGFWINYGVNEHVSPHSRSQWRIPVGVQFGPAVLLIVGMFFVIDSPRWLIKKGRIDQATKDLVWLRQLPADHPYIVHEINDVKQQLEHEQELSGGNSFASIAKEAFSKETLPRLAAGCAIQILQNTTGINAINYFSPSIFKSIGFKGTSVGLLATGVYGIVKTTFACISFLLLCDRFGRRPLLLIGSAGCAFAMYYLAIYTSLSGSFKGTAKQDGGSYTAIVMIYLYATFYASSWNLSWIVCSEIFPTRIRSFCLIFTTCSQWLGQFIVVYSTPYMITNITYGTFLFFGSMTVIAAVWVFFVLPETKGVPLEEMDYLWQAKGTAIQKRKAWEEMKNQRVEFRQGENDKAEVVAAHLEKIDV